MMETSTKILLIEDNVPDAEIITRMLEKTQHSKFDVVHVQRLADGIALLSTDPGIDVVLLDLGLPDSRGIDTFHSVNSKRPDKPVIILTGLEDQEIATQAIGLGAQDYLVKGKISGSALDRSIRYAIERKRSEVELRQLTDRITLILETAGEGILGLDTAGTIIFINDAATEMFGYSTDELIGRNCVVMFHHSTPGGKPYPVAQCPIDSAFRHGSNDSGEEVFWRKDGTSFAVDFTSRPLYENNTVIGAVVTFRDITERKQAEALLQRNEERFRQAFANAPIGMVIADINGRYLFANSTYQQITGFTEDELRQPGLTFNVMTHPDDRRKFDVEITRLQSRQIESFFIEIRYRTKRQDTVWVRLSATLQRDARDRRLQIVALVEDINERKRLEEEVKHMAHHDPLTGLPNRRMFNDVARLEIAEAKRHGTKLAIMYMDLDRFKEVNDTLGHNIGDLLLKEAADRIQSVIRTSDTVARIGGDEFSVVAADISHAESAAEAAGKILAAIRKPFLIKDHELNLSTSIGISIFPDDSERIDELLQYADIAMYYAKEHGRNMFQFYSPAINTRSLERVRFQNDLRRAIERDEFRLHFQPLVDMKTKKIVSAEALLRWQHPERGLLLPDEFFGTAQDVGLMPEIENWVLTNVGNHVNALTGKGMSPLCLTMNVSARQFHNRDLLSKISGILDDTGLRPECLDIEITEAAAMQDVDSAIEKISELRSLGVQVSIDDFGIGYSSLNQLKRLPVQRLKIDRSFVRDIASDPSDRKIVTAVLHLAHSLDLKAVAEGVENYSQMSFLRALKCDEAQGNYFSKPLPAEELKKLLAAA